MFNFTEQDIINFFEERLNNFVRETGNKIADALEAKLSAVPSEYYDRTGQVVNAFRNPPPVQLLGNGSLSSRIINFDLIKNQRSSVPGKLNHHMSIDGSKTFAGENIKYWVPVWLDDGFTLLNGAYYEGLDYYKLIFGSRDLDSFIQEEFENAAFEFTLIVNKAIEKGGI